MFFLHFLVIKFGHKTLDPYPDPDLLEMLDPDSYSVNPDPQLCFTGSTRPLILYVKQSTCDILGSFVGLHPVERIRIRMDPHSIFCPGFGSELECGLRIRIQ
jgi:hypothetical protein